MDMAAHLQVLGESLNTMGQTLQQQVNNLLGNDSVKKSLFLPYSVGFVFLYTFSALYTPALYWPYFFITGVIKASVKRTDNVESR